MDTAPRPDDRLRLATPAGRWVLAATVLGSAMASIDSTVVGIALPAMGRNLHADLAGLQWVVTSYLLALAGLLLVGGALGDRYGRKRIFLTGVVWFAVASALCAAAPGAGTLIAARGVQGIGAALMTPGSLAILQASFRPEDRGRAIGAWSGLSGVGTAVGPFLGGWLVSAASWRWIFLINIPIALAVVLMTWRHVPESRDPDASGRVDILGGALVTAGLVGLTYGLIEAPSSGWSQPQVVAALLGGSALLGLFVLRERHAEHALLPLELFGSMQFSATNLVTFIVYGALGGALFLLPIQLQQVCGYSALESGVAILPVTLIVLLLSSRSGGLAQRIGPRLQMSVGPIIVGLGLTLFVRVGSDGNYWTEVLPGMVVFGFGLAITVAPLTATVLAAVSSRHAGAASAVNNDVARAASLIAVAVLPAAAGITGNAYLHPRLFNTGFEHAVIIAGGLCAVAGLLAALTIRNHRPTRRAGAPASALHCDLDAPVPQQAPGGG